MWRCGKGLDLGRRGCPGQRVLGRVQSIERERMGSEGGLDQRGCSYISHIELIFNITYYI